ncbi:hypothetical protein GYMLUDRAFT_43863 [Collybiopsis luxurians FD-317 M1]|uniref:Uncharacterized protein n=1 Tax=Collybiopsis luxurians FD-317 M1 TaxID=944289 RepID=A0A0D0B946_9AGAR|nr:hypothetical protein GYMLUDRAFT_43863 [Collybiopsis luxurians FD-317 M1]
MDALEERALQLAIEQIYQASGTVENLTDSGNGAGCMSQTLGEQSLSLRVGEILLSMRILLCQRIVAVMWQERWAKKVASRWRLFDTRVMSCKVAHHYFENSITHFTRRISKVVPFPAASTLAFM